MLKIPKIMEVAKLSLISLNWYKVFQNIFSQFNWFSRSL